MRLKAEQFAPTELIDRERNKTQEPRVTKKEVVSPIGIWKRITGYTERGSMAFNLRGRLVEKVNWAPRTSQYWEGGVEVLTSRLKKVSKNGRTPAFTGCLPPARGSAAGFIYCMSFKSLQ